MQKLMPCSKSTKVSSLQSSFLISSRVTSSPARAGEQSENSKGLRLELDGMLVLAQLPPCRIEPETAEPESLPGGGISAHD